MDAMKKPLLPGEVLRSEFGYGILKLFEWHYLPEDILNEDKLDDFWSKMTHYWALSVERHHGTPTVNRKII